MPQRFLRRLPTINAEDWWNNFAAEQLRNDVNYEVMRNVRKADIVAAARQQPQKVEEWAISCESGPADAYDFDADPLGISNWLRLAQAFVAGSPLAVQEPTNDAEFETAIEAMIDRYRHYIEEQDGWQLLWNDDRSEKHEGAAQLLFRGVVESYCETNNIVLDREVNLGRGSVDFKFSRGYRQRALLEVKKLHNGRFWSGLRLQLPSYLRSDRCCLGWFLVVQYRTTGTSASWLNRLPAVLKEVAEATPARLLSRTVDARPKVSASHIEAVNSAELSADEPAVDEGSEPDSEGDGYDFPPPTGDL